MAEMIWLNGETLPLAEARIDVEDRGFQFADGVYEVIRLYNGRPFTLVEHMERLERSAAGIMLALPLGTAELASEIEKFIRKQGPKDGMVYLQLTRGVAPRNHLFSACKPTLLFYTRPLPPVPKPGESEGVKLFTVADERWQRCWIKSIALLPNVLAKNAAVAAGADEAVFSENGIVTECSSSNFFAVIRGELLTHPVGPKVLSGVSRLALLELARQIDVPAAERPVSEAEAMEADELFITSTIREIGWVTRWNDRSVGEGRCGPVTLKLHRAFQERIARETM
jgi:D-alanine transaminase